MIKGMNNVINQVNRMIKANKAIGKAIGDGHADMADRIFAEGRDAHGQLIGDGEYSPAYAAYRNKKGRSSYPITLRFTGDMERSFVFEPSGDSAWVSGFTSDGEADKAKWNEDRYRQEIFMMSDSEVAKVVNSVETIISKALR